MHPSLRRDLQFKSEVLPSGHDSEPWLQVRDRRDKRGQIRAHPDPPACHKSVFEVVRHPAAPEDVAFVT